LGWPSLAGIGIRHLERNFSSGANHGEDRQQMADKAGETNRVNGAIRVILTEINKTELNQKEGQSALRVDLFDAVASN
jgi:hypothetical protein